MDCHLRVYFEHFQMRTWLSSGFLNIFHLPGFQVMRDIIRKNNVGDNVLWLLLYYVCVYLFVETEVK